MNRSPTKTPLTACNFPALSLARPEPILRARLPRSLPPSLHRHDQRVPQPASHAERIVENPKSNDRQNIPAGKKKTKKANGPRRNEPQRSSARRDKTEPGVKHTRPGIVWLPSNLIRLA